MRDFDSCKILIYNENEYVQGHNPQRAPKDPGTAPLPTSPEPLFRDWVIWGEYELPGVPMPLAFDPLCYCIAGVPRAESSEPTCVAEVLLPNLRRR